MCQSKINLCFTCLHQAQKSPKAASALGLTPRTVSAYGSGARQVPRAVLLALKGWEVEQAERQ